MEVIGMETMGYQLEELIPLVAELATGYGGYEHTSITYERAEMLMEAVLYCIHECAEHTSGEYICKEQAFLRRFDEGHVMDVLRAYHPEYEILVENICEIMRADMEEDP